MPSTDEIESLIKKIKDKYVLTDYDLGVLATIKFYEGGSNPYKDRVE